MVCECLVAGKIRTNGSSDGSDHDSGCSVIMVGVVLPGDQVQMSLLHRIDTDEDDEEVMIEGELMEKYPY